MAFEVSASSGPRFRTFSGNAGDWASWKAEFECLARLHNLYDLSSEPRPKPLGAKPRSQVVDCGIHYWCIHRARHELWCSQLINEMV